jgi:DNA repair/transcription protein MET18/MMS19
MDVDGTSGGGSTLAGLLHPQEALELFLAQRDEALVRIVADGITRGEMDLLSVIQRLGPALTGASQQRATATLLLALLLQELPLGWPSPAEAHVLATFFCDRLSDHHSLVPALKGLLALHRRPNLLADLAIPIAASLFQHILVQARPSVTPAACCSLTQHTHTHTHHP